MGRTTAKPLRGSRTHPAPGEDAQHVNRNLLMVGALLAACACGWWASRGPGDAVVERPPGITMGSNDLAPAIPDRAHALDPAARSPAGAKTESDAQFERYVDDKYRLLFRDIGGDAATALRAALQRRELVVTQINTARQTSDPALRETLPLLEARKVDIDRGIGALLPARELGAFEALRDSDIERFQVEDYAAGIQDVAPLSEADKQSILATKLAYRERFRQVLADSRLMSGELTDAERALAFDEVSRALRESQRNYLQEVRQYLYDDAQYALLSNYETTEFEAETAKLRGIAGLDR